MLPRMRAVHVLSGSGSRPLRAPPGHGQPLPEELQREAESLFGADFSDVRIFVSPAPGRLGARAMTSGPRIYVARSEYQPGTQRWLRLLGHELAHVLQQKKGKVRNRFGYGVDVVRDPHLESEAERMGSALVQAWQRRSNALQGGQTLQMLNLKAWWRWTPYLQTLVHQQACDVIDTNTAKTTLETRLNLHGEITHYVIRLHNYSNGSWSELGSVTIDRLRVPRQGPVLDGAPQLPDGYDDRELTLHTAAAGGAGNAGVAMYLFPAALRWINNNLRGIQQVNMNPAGGAASKSVIEQLGGSVGNGPRHHAAEQRRAQRRNAGGNPIAGGDLNTWDSRLNAEHQFELQALDEGMVGVSVIGDGMSLAGPAQPADVHTMRALRDFFHQMLAQVPADPVINGAHPAAAYFQAAAALSDANIDAAPRQAALTLRMARLTSRSGANGEGGTPDAGYIIRLTGEALHHLMPNASP